MSAGELPAESSLFQSVPWTVRWWVGESCWNLCQCRHSSTQWGRVMATGFWIMQSLDIANTPGWPLSQICVTDVQKYVKNIFQSRFIFSCYLHTTPGWPVSQICPWLAVNIIFLTIRVDCIGPLYYFPSPFERVDWIGTLPMPMCGCNDG